LAKSLDGDGWYRVEVNASKPTIFSQTVQRDSIARSKRLAGILLDPIKCNQFAVQHRQINEKSSEVQEKKVPRFPRKKKKESDSAEVVAVGASE
jgi:hypothetical protein